MQNNGPSPPPKDSLFLRTQRRCGVTVESGQTDATLLALKTEKGATSQISQFA